jgi:hypothetical protein
VAYSFASCQQQLGSLGNAGVGTKASEAQAYIDAESKCWHEIVSAAGIRQERRAFTA